MFKGIGIKTKTVFIPTVIMGLMILVGGVGIYAIEHLSKSLVTIADQSLPAIRSMTLVSVMHNGIRSVVFRSLVEGPTQKDDMLNEYNKLSLNMTAHLADIEKLTLSPNLNESITKTWPAIKKFQDDGLKVIQAATSGDKVQALSCLPGFVASFERLESDLEKLDKIIQQAVTAQSNQSQKDASELKNFSMMIVSISLVFSAVVSYLAYSFITGLTTNLLGITKGLKEEAQEIVLISQNMAQVSTRLSEASTQQAASLQETVSSIDEISAMIAKNADSAETSAKMSEQSTLIAQKGKVTTEMMMDSISTIASGNDEIIQQMQKSNTEISEIAKVIQDIGQKTQVINDIVFQTKLLSFNASVEAARAGEHGKGFAVVAQEVGNLASMSGNAATEITDMLTKSVKRVTEIVDGTKGLMDGLIKQSKQKVAQGADTAKQCQHSLDEILSNVSSVNQMIREISTASQEQATGVREVNKAMSELDQVTQSNSGIAHESSKSAKGLNHQAEKLNQLVLDLTRIVGGGAPVRDQRVHSYIPPRTTAATRVQANNVIELKKPFHQAPKREVGHHAPKKVVGLDVKAPHASDARFEDA